MTFAVPALQLLLHLLERHVASVFPFGQAINTKHAPVVAGFSDVDFDVAPWIPSRVVWLVVHALSRGFGPNA
jgi:hypothetical protein